MRTITRTLGLVVLLWVITAIPIWASPGIGSSPYFMRVRNGSIADIDYNLFIQQRR